MPNAPSSRYESKRSSDWLKIKIVTQQEFVIGGFTEPQGERSHFGALVLGVYEDGKLNWVGNAGTGFDQKTLTFLYCTAETAHHRQVSLRRAAQTRSRHDVGQAGIDRPGEIHAMDTR